MGKTIAIIDLAHSGTTMVAGICEILAVPMVIGSHHPMKWEDADIIDTLHTRQDEVAFATLVRERDKQYNNWGFKLPGAWKYAAWLKKYLRNPVYLAIYKDPVSVTRRRFGKSQDLWLRKVRNTVRQQKESIDGIYASCLRPMYALSYHKAIITPVLFVQEIATAIGFKGDEELLNKAAEYIQPNKGGPTARYPEIKTWIS